METVRFQIGQCRLNVEIDRTKDYYKSQPRISENCTCDDCSYFENKVTKKDIGLMKILAKMGVDLARQPNVNPDGVSCIGETTKYNKGYIGYYNVYGEFGKTQKTTQTKNADGMIESVDFYEPEEDSYTQFKIKQITDDQLEIEFFIECEKKK